MFYSDVILSKRGPLAKVWLAAHAERRLTKTQLLQTDIEKSVESIIGPDVVPMALRLSGQLLLGVVRIYSRKAKYLLEDCNDAMMKLKTAFHSGAVDFTTHAANLPLDNVTLPATRTALDLALPDPALEGWDAESSIGGGDAAAAGRLSRASRYTARPADITLRRYLDPDYQSSGESMIGWTSADFFDPDGGNGGQGAAAAAMLERRDSQGRLVDENGDPLPEAEAAAGDESSIGIGRDVQMPQGGSRPSLGIGGGDLTGFDDFGGGDDFLLQGMGDVGGDTSGGLDLGLEEFDAQRRSMTPMRQQQSEASLLQNLTPRTARHVQEAAQKRMASTQKARKLQLIDARTQLQDNDRRASQGATEGIVLAEQTLLPHSREHLYLLSLEQDPSKGLLPFATLDAEGRQTFTGAQMLAPQLCELFTFNPSMLARRRPALGAFAEEEERARKRLRGEGEEEGEDEFGSEIGRRRAPEDPSQFDLSLGADIDMPEMSGAAFDDDPAMFFDVPDVAFAEAEETRGAMAPPPHGVRRSQRKRASDMPTAQEEEQERRRRAFHEEGMLRRLSTPSEHSAAAEVASDVSPTSSYPLRAFDEAVFATSTSESPLSQQPGTISRNTRRAITALRYELKPEQRLEQQDDDEEQVAAATTVAFKQVTRNASRRAAAAFFFEVLQLGTKDCLNVEQEEAYGDITIEAKPSLWEL